MATASLTMSSSMLQKINANLDVDLDASGVYIFCDFTKDIFLSHILFVKSLF